MIEIMGGAAFLLSIRYELLCHCSSDISIIHFLYHGSRKRRRQGKEKKLLPKQEPETALTVFFVLVAPIIIFVPLIFVTVFFLIIKDERNLERDNLAFVVPADVQIIPAIRFRGAGTPRLASERSATSSFYQKTNPVLCRTILHFFAGA